ncbi:hypothetical protein [Aquimarina sp. AU58]|uniref:hypothetical protein n=1 Tax=Aquimarina sp. AU58 TaxID=1874112 RepID=UPI00135C277D|nr:hypothetical protein [Aquimarina sp. AU58]
MKKTILTTALILFSVIIYSKTSMPIAEYVITGGIENGTSGVLTDAKNALNNSGVITIKGDITISGNTIIPEGIELNFFRGNKLIVKGNVKVTLNGSINAGSYQIFELENNGTIEDCQFDRWDMTLDDGKVTGNLKNNFVIPQWWGADDTGKHDCSEAFQKAIEAFPNVKKFVAAGKFIVYKEIFLNQDNRYYDFAGATFIGVNTSNDNHEGLGERPICSFLRNDPDIGPNGYDGVPATWPAVQRGGMIGIGKLQQGNETSPYSVQNVTLYGGFYKPMSIYDVAIGIYNSKNIKVLNVNINCYEGLRGIAIQHDPWPVLSRTDDVIIKDVIQNGGVNIINIDILENNPHYVKNIIIDNIIGHDVVGKEPLNKEDREAGKEEGRHGYAFRISSQGSGENISNVSISNVILSYINGGFYFDGVTGVMSNIQIIGYNKDKHSYEPNFPPGSPGMMSMQQSNIRIVE